MKRLITLTSSALFAIAAASPLLAGDGAIRSSDQAAPPSQKTVRAPASETRTAKPPVRRDGKASDMRKTARVKEMLRNKPAPQGLPATSTVPNQMMPGEAMNRAPRQDKTGTSAASSTGGQNEARTPTPAGPATYTPGASFGGYDSDDNAALFDGGRIAPPDTNGDVGRDHYVQWNNLGWKYWDKATLTENGPFPGNSFWDEGTACGDNNDGDPIVIYDHVAGRWVFTQFEVSTGVGIACFAVSEGENPAGPYTTYEFPIAIAGFNDYPKMGLWVTEGCEGIWTDDSTAVIETGACQSAYHMTTNEFDGGTFAFIGVQVTAFDRDAILAGDPDAGFQQFTIDPVPNADGRFAFGIQPPNLEGSILPPPGTCAPYVQAFDDNTWGTGDGTSADVDGYRFWEFCVDFSEDMEPPMGQTVCRDPALPIAINDDGITMDTIVMAAPGTITDLDVSIDATHTWVGDLSFAIDKTGGTGAPPASLLLGDKCDFNGYENIDTIRDDAAPPFIDVDSDSGGDCFITPPAIAGSYAPETPLSVFNGEDIAGTYTLTILDDFAADTGTLNDWCLIFNSEGPPPGAPATAGRAPAVGDGASFVELDFVPTTLPFDAIPFQVPQPNGQPLDTLSQFTMYRFSVRMVGDHSPTVNAGAHTLRGVISHTVNLGTPGDFTGSAESWDLFGDASNQTLVVDFGAPVVVDGIGWDWSISTVGSSWLSEADTTASGTTEGVTITPGINDGFAGSASYSSGGVIDLVGIGLDFQVLDGMMNVEFSESFDDIADAIDAYEGGTFTFTAMTLGGDDTDGDGVADGVDACPNTDWPDAYPLTGSLGRGRYTLESPPDFTRAMSSVRVPPYSLAESNGCSCDDLIDGGHAVGSLRSQIRRGCTLATLDNAPEPEGDGGGAGEVVVREVDFPIILPTQGAGAQWAIFDLGVSDFNGEAPVSPALLDTGVADGVLNDGLHRWMPSVTLDRVGNMGMVYSRSGGPCDEAADAPCAGDEFPSVYYTGREAGDPMGVLQDETSCIDGAGVQEGTDRWGDYASASVDPVDECTIWITNEYVEVTGNFDWDTQICSFKFASCDFLP